MDEYEVIASELWKRLKKIEAICEIVMRGPSLKLGEIVTICKLPKDGKNNS